MIFINKFADFSENKIGNVEIPIDIDETASEIMQKYTKTLSSQQQVAFSQLIAGMKNAGIYQKVEFLFLPCLASSVTEAFYEVINNIVTDMSDASTYGQFSVDNNGLMSTYDSAKTYSPKGVNITRSTYGGTFSSIFHASSALSAYYYYLAAGGSGKGIKNSNVRSTNATIVTTMNGNKIGTFTFPSNNPSIGTLVNSVITDTASYLPSASNNKAIRNGEAGTFSTTEDTAITIDKTAGLYLAGYSTYGSSFACAGGTLDVLIISSLLDGVSCVDNPAKDMAVRMDELLATFKNAFF